MFPRIHGLVAASHTPFHGGGSLNLAVVEQQAEHLLQQQVQAVFICGSTGESHSLTVEERRQMAVRWMEVTRGSELNVIVHVGANCLEDARALAVQAGQLGAAGFAMLTPSYFKPASIDALTDCCAHIAEAAPQLPFYYYDIPSMTGVNQSMPEFLKVAGHRIRNLAGLKFTNIDLIAFQLCRDFEDQRFDILWGVDELLLAALSYGAKGAVGSTYNFAAPIYHRLISAFQAGDFEAARAEQLTSIRLVQVLAKRGYFASAKLLMERQGVAVGPPRLPHCRLSLTERDALYAELDELGF